MFLNEYITVQYRAIQNHVFSAINKKIGNIRIQLEPTPNAKARVIIGDHHKYFINQKEALLWLIYSYNLKHLKNVFLQRPPKEIVKTPEVNKPVLIGNAAKMLFEKIAHQDYFNMEIYRGIEEHFCAFKTANDFTEQEMEHVTVLVIEQLTKVLEETFNNKRHLVLKRYLERLKSKDNFIE